MGNIYVVLTVTTLSTMKSVFLLIFQLDLHFYFPSRLGRYIDICLQVDPSSNQR